LRQPKSPSPAQRQVKAGAAKTKFYQFYYGCLTTWKDNIMKTKRNLIQTCLLGAVLLQAATSGAQPVTISTSTLIDVGNTTYEGKDIIVTGCTLTVNGSHAFNSLQVANAAVVTHSPAAAGQTNNRVNLTIAQDALIDSTSGIDASFKGYNADYPGPGAGVTGTVSGDWASGGGYGGFGADSSAGAKGGGVYGSITQPVDWAAPAVRARRTPVWAAPAGALYVWRWAGL